MPTGLLTGSREARRWRREPPALYRRTLGYAVLAIGMWEFFNEIDNIQFPR